MSQIHFFSPRKELLQPVSQLGSGGEGNVFLLEENTALKIFNSKVDLELKNKKIDALFSKKKVPECFCVPTMKVYTDKGTLAGYTMKLAQGEIMQWSVFSRKGLLARFPEWTRSNLARLAINLLTKIEMLRNEKILIGDINPYNIIINNEDDIYFIDIDSYQIDNMPCTVGLPLFTPPELQGANFRKILRTAYNENFSLGTLLFMIFLPGKNPFEYVGGSDLINNIKDQNFSYPLGDEDNLRAPKGIWEFIWNDLNYELRRAFYNVFKNVQRLTIKQWIKVIDSYYNDLEKGYCPNEIFPPLPITRLSKFKSLNINRRDINESDALLRNDTTLLSLSKKKKIGVMELSTTAIKLLWCVNDQPAIGKFDFTEFLRPSTRTNTGKLLNSENIMDLQGFNDSVVPKINEYIEKAVNAKITILYTVATAAYRSARNRTEVLESIKMHCGLNVRILTKKEEALATLTAFIYTKNQDIHFDKDKNFVFIDLGGGSTEITIFKGQEINETYSINLGSMVLKNIFFRDATDLTTFNKAFRDSEKLIKDRLRTYLRNSNPQNLGNFCISVGNPIMQATGAKAAVEKHCKRLTTADIREKMHEFETLIQTRFTSLTHLYQAIEDNERKEFSLESKSDQVDNILVARLSLPIYIEIMERFSINEVITSNTGLFYGIFFEKLTTITL